MKPYIKPQSYEVSLQSEALLALSLPTSSTDSTDNNWSERQGWDSSNWSGTDEEE